MRMTKYGAFTYLYEICKRKKRKRKTRDVIRDEKNINS